MLLVLDQVLTDAQQQQIREKLSGAQFVTGSRTAGWHAQQVKQNTQLDTQDPVYASLCHLVKEALNKQPLFQTAVFPAVIHNVRFSQYEVGMAYGQHVDNAFMGQGDRRFRSDVSWTIFLSDPETYDGGELIIEGSEGSQSFKLAEGAVLLYPSSYLHQVAPVTAGVRLAAVGWVQSVVRSASQREMLFDLDAVRRSLFKQQGKTVEFDLVTKTYTNLLREWGELP